MVLNAKITDPKYLCYAYYFSKVYIKKVEVKVSHCLIAVGAMEVRVPLYLGHS